MSSNKKISRAENILNEARKLIGDPKQFPEDRYALLVVFNALEAWIGDGVAILR